jgi:hypothetical protein
MLDLHHVGIEIQKEKDHRKALVILWGVNKERAKMSHLLHEL